MEERSAILEQIMKHMGSLHRHMATSRDAFLAQFDLSRPQIELLFSVKHGKRSVKDLAAYFGVSSSAISQMIAQLEANNLVERRQDETDRRITYVQLSRGGKKAFQSIRDSFMNHLNDKFNKISLEELTQLRRIIAKITVELEKE